MYTIKTILGFLLLLVTIIIIVICVDKAAVFYAGNDTATYWSIIGAYGSWAGSLFGAVALIVSFLALWLPQRVKIDVSVKLGFMFSPLPGVNNLTTYIITVRNMSMKPVTIENIYLHFDDNSQEDIFVGMLNPNVLVQGRKQNFPVRLEQGASCDYNLLRDELDKELLNHKGKSPLSAKLSIRVDEVTIGQKYYETKFTLGTFIQKYLKDTSRQ